MIETQWVIGVRRYIEGALDAHGNVSDTWTQPTNVKVYSIAPSVSDEPFEPGRQPVVTGLTVLAPKDTQIHPKDLVVIDGKEYTVNGEISDWNTGPFGWEPGVSINLERVDG